MVKAGQWLLQPSVSDVAGSLLGLMVDILSTFGAVSVVQCVKLMLKFFEFGVLLFDYFVYSPKSNLPETFYQVWALRR